MKVIEATAKGLWDFEEQRMSIADDKYCGRRYEPCPWADAHPLDHAEYTEKALAAIHAYETAKGIA